MVGVPGRSKACSTCKKRHIACDLRHLDNGVCGPCTKSKRVCSFPRKNIFVNHDEGTHKTVYRKTDGERDFPNHQAPLVYSVDLRDTRPDSSNQPSPEQDNMPSFLLCLPRNVQSTALVKQQFLANAKQALCAGQMEETQFPPFWSSAITTPSLNSWACRTSPALACYTAWLGRQTSDPRLIDASHRLYMQGLREVQCSINDPSTALRDETLSACIGLIIFEALECPDRSYAAYHKHIEGCNALIRMRGVNAHRDGIGHELFRGFRYIAVIKALQDHRGTYLTTPSWSEIPFSVHGKDIHDRLLDILARGANFLGEGDRLATTSPNHILTALLNIDDRLRSLDSELEALYAELGSEQPGPPYWTVRPWVGCEDEKPEPIVNSDLMDFAAMPITFRDQEVARLLTLYWSQQCLLRMGRSEVCAALAGMAAAGMVSGQAERVNNSLSHRCKPLIETAHLVLRSRDYCCSSQSTLLRYSVPLNITLDVLANKPEQYVAEISFAKAIKKDISSRYLRITQFTGTLRHVKEV